MNENTTNAGEREALVAAQEEAAERFKEVCRKATAHQKKTMENWIERLGLGGKFRVERVNLSYGMSVATMPDERGRTDDIDVCFSTDLYGERNPDGSKRRNLEISMRSTRLKVGRKEDLLMAAVAGKFAENLAAMEADFRAFDWALFDRAEREVYSAGEALRDFDADAKRAEFDRKAAEMLAKFGVDYEMTIISAHRMPDTFVEYATKAEERGIEVIIAGAGGAAHLPGMCAALFDLPVIGVPIHTKSAGGLDSLYSIVQMPSGIPVATVAIDGAANAGILAAKILSIQDPDLRNRLKDYKVEMKDGVQKKADKLGEIGYEAYLDQM